MVRALAGEIVLCSWARHFILTVPLSTQVYKWVPANLKCKRSDSHRGQKIFSLPRVVPCFPLLGLTPSGLFMGLSTTSELILCSTICVPSATRHNIHMYCYFLFAAIHHLKSSPTFSVRPCSSVGRVTVDLIRRWWVRFPPRSKDFFFASCGSLFPFTRANAQWVIHFNFQIRVTKTKFVRGLV